MGAALEALACDLIRLICRFRLAICSLAASIWRHRSTAPWGRASVPAAYCSQMNWPSCCLIRVIFFCSSLIRLLSLVVYTRSSAPLFAFFAISVSLSKKAMDESSF